MPTYEYRRPDGSTFEVFQKITADPLTEDPETGVPVTRVISGGAGLQFKGTGFYLTDYPKSTEGTGNSDAGKKLAQKKDSGPDSSKSSETKTSNKSSDSGGSTSAGSTSNGNTSTDS